MSDFDRVREILAAATKSTWWLFDEPAETRGVYGPDGDELARVQGNLALGGDALDNARAIVVARNLAPELLAVAEAAESFVTLTDDLARWDELNRYVINSERDYLAGNVAAARERLDAALDALHAKMKETL